MRDAKKAPRQEAERPRGEREQQTGGKRPADLKPPRDKGEQVKGGPYRYK